MVVGYQGDLLDYTYRCTSLLAENAKLNALRLSDLKFLLINSVSKKKQKI